MRLEKSLWAFAAAACASAQPQVSNLVTVGAFTNYVSTYMAKDVWGYTAGGREYALQTYVNGMSVLEVTNPAAIREVAFISAPNTNWKTVKTYRNYAYLGADGGGTGLQIINLAGLPNSVQQLATYVGGAGNTAFTSTHNIWVDTARALLYASGLNGQNFRVLNLQNPGAPSQLAYITVESHDFYTRGNFMYLSTAYTDQWMIYDMANPSAPQRMRVVQFPGGNTLSHNVWLTDNGNYLLSTEEFVNKSLKVWDIRNTSNITLVEEYLAGGDPSTNIAHNVYIKNDTAYVSHYGQGFRVLDARDPLNLREIAYYRPQYPAQQPNFYTFGSFANYPWLPSGNLLSSDAVFGLTIHRFPTTAITPKKPRARRMEAGGWEIGYAGKLFSPDGRRIRAAALRERKAW